MNQRLYTEYFEIQFNRKSTSRGYFLKKFRRYPLFALWKNSQSNKKISQRRLENNMDKELCKKRKNMDKFVRYSDGIELYHISVSTFMQWAKDANVIYKVGNSALINTELFEAYLKKFIISE